MAFFYSDGTLHIGDARASVAVDSIVGALDRPAYVYDLDDIALRFHAMNHYFAAFVRAWRRSGYGVWRGNCARSCRGRAC